METIRRFSEDIRAFARKLRHGATLRSIKLPLLIGLITSLALDAFGQSDSAKVPARTEAGLYVTVAPVGAEVALRGEAELRGVAPVFFSQGIPGRYRLVVSKFGYEKFSSTVFVTSDRVTTLDIHLSPKTRGKAAMRSLFVPGWGQIYGGQSGKGAIFLAMGAIGAGVVAGTELNFRTKKDDYDAANIAYEKSIETGDVDKVNQARGTLQLMKARAYDAESLRRGAMVGAIALWGVSFLDALLLFPGGGDAPAKGKVAVVPSTDISKGEVGFRISTGL